MYMISIFSIHNDLQLCLSKRSLDLYTELLQELQNLDERKSIKNKLKLIKN